MAEIKPLALDGVFEIIPRRFGDDRGWFSETWNNNGFADAGLKFDWIQDNQAYSAAKGILRGLHFQKPPMAQTKLVRCLRGSVFDVAVDIRKGSPNYGKWVGLTLSAKTGNQILVPKGFAHGYLTLEPDCEVFYKVDAGYAPDEEGAVHFADSDIGIKWPLPTDQITLNEKDRSAPLLADQDAGFTY